MRPTPGQVAAGVTLGIISALTLILVRRLASAPPPPGSSGAVMDSARGSAQVRGIVRSGIGQSSSRSSEAEAPGCSAHCGEPLNFETGAVRCPYGDTPEHRTGGLFHPDCLTEAGQCPYCQFALRGVDTYLVHDAITIPPRPAEVWANVVAARWAPGFQVRQVGMLCHATAASAVWRAFGHAKTPMECAHEWATSATAISMSLYPKYRAEFASHRTAPTDTVLQIQGFMANDEDGRQGIEDLTRRFGEPILTGIGAGVSTVTAINFAGPGSIRAAIDANRLIMAGDYNHWYVVFGYATSNTGGQRVAYYDPMAGAARESSYASFISGKEEFKVIG